jgi:transcriptional regulator with XRE-family HTH domain
MSGRDAKPRPPTALGRALKIYRDQHKFTQEQLAALLDEDTRQVRRWENGETQLTDIRELKRIADRLGIPYKDLGIAASIYVPITLEEIHTKVDRIWTLIDEAYIDEAYTVAENLILEASQRTGASDVQTLHTLARMYHAAAHATSLSLKTEEVGQILYYYQQMEYFARQVKDDTLVNISLAYQGDMFRRKGDIPHAIQYLERARDTTPQADEAARGNALQLLARTYIQGQSLENFDRTIKEAEELAYAIDQRNNSVRQFNLGYVFEEYAKSYGRLGKTQLALDYIDRAEKYRTPTKSSEILMKVARAEILVREGDVRNAVPLAAEAAIYSREHGHNRRLERIYAIKRYIHQQATKYGKAEWELNEALEGPNEY